MQAAAHTPGGYGGVPQSVGKEFVGDSAFEEPGPDLTDHQVAEGIRDGKFLSPTKYDDFWLFDLRVTGTNAAYRDSLDEWAFRNPKLWLTDEFLERAASVPVIFGHPEGSGLNSEEYADRSIGNMVLSYRKGDEVWGVAKIFNSDAAVAMQTTHRSTSPGVSPPKGAVATELNDGTKVLDEGLPRILDHLAICEAGVWDKDGPPSGIRLDARLRKDEPVADKTKEELEREDAQRRADAAELEDFRKADKARKDAEEKEREDKRRKDESDKEAIEAAEKEKADKAKKDARRKDWETKKDSESEEECEKRQDTRMDGESDEEFEDRKKDRKAKKDAALAGGTAPKTPVDADRGVELHDSKRVTDLEALIKRQGEQLAAMTAQPSIEDANEIAKAWGRWDSLYQMLGDQTPRAYPGEKPRAYLRRLADGVRKYTTSFANYVFHDSQQAIDFGLVADRIFTEALEYSKKPVVTKGRLREIVTYPHGKTRTEFIGDQNEVWGPFEHHTDFYIKKISRPVGNVYEGTR